MDLDYILVLSNDEIELAEKMTRYLRAGWLPIGGIFINNKGTLYQAIYKTGQHIKQPVDSKLDIKPNTMFTD